MDCFLSLTYNPSTTSMPHRLVIVGAGFSGTFIARQLSGHKLPDLEVTLIDPKDHFLFTPRLIDSLASILPTERRWSSSLQALATRSGFRFLQGKVEHVNREQKTLTVYTEATGTRTVPYDQLILSPGAKTCYYKISGAAEHALSLKTNEDVTRIHARIDSLLTQAQHAEKPDEKRRLLSFVIVGAGPSGIEGIFAVRAYILSWCQQHHADLTALASYSLIQAGPQILPGFPLKIVQGVSQELQRNGIRTFVGEAVTEVTETSLTTNLKHTLPASMVLWTAGIEPNTVPVEPEAHRDPMGYLIVDRFLQVEPTIFAAGDAILYRENNQVIPRNAQTAILMGKLLAENMLRTRRHESLRPFNYHSKGNILVAGNTGYLDLKFFSVKTRFAPFIRDLFYRFRFWEITGKW